MGYHHLALAVRDMAAIHAFYTRAMGFELVKVEAGATPESRGWAKHFFYDTGDGTLMAFWELHDDSMPQAFETGISRAVGLPDWVNHIAFHARDLEEIAVRKQRWLDCGYDVAEIDHRWCHSVYTVDPNGTLVEFCTTTGAFDAEDREKALRALTSDDLELVEPKSVHFHKSKHRPVHLAA